MVGKKHNTEGESDSLDRYQRIGLRELINAGQRLKTPFDAPAQKGLDGILRANRMLRERESVGILIGSLSEVIWHYDSLPESLYSYKDVDVMVLDQNFKLEKNFEGGIDWWLPTFGEIEIDRPGYEKHIQLQRYWKNAHGVSLGFGAEKKVELPHGLYIMNPHQVMDMREYESDAHVDIYDFRGSIDMAVFEAYRSVIGRSMGKKLPKYVSDAFEGHILSPKYHAGSEMISSIKLLKFDYGMLVAINRLEQYGPAVDACPAVEQDSSVDKVNI
jgi:hypothetical protein